MGVPVRLAEFILANIEPILVDWEAFARGIWPAMLSDPAIDPITLRDHAKEILYATAEEMASDQTSLRQSEKSKGVGRLSAEGVRIDRASARHGVERGASGFDIGAVVAEYRALRASVIRLWHESGADPDRRDLEDLTRFNESIDQSLAEAIRSFTEKIQKDREVLLANEQDARKEAENANRAKDMFLATLSHEMRTPLNAIVGWIGILRIVGLSGADLQEGLDVIERNTKAQVQLMEDVLDVSRIVSGKLRLEIRDSDLIDVINAGIEVVRPSAEARDITFDVHLDPAARRASFDATRMQQVVWNLLTNAIKFTQKHGIIGVTLDRERSGLRIAVSDNGQGISADLLPYVFDRFRQADSSTRRRYGGLGLGLSIVKHLAEMHGGSVEAQSAGEGRGSTFIIRLPIKAVHLKESELDGKTDDDIESEHASVPPPVPLNGVRVLVVDDEADARRMLEKVLGNVGASVTTAGSAAEALAALNDNSSNVLVSDIGMPGQDGYDLIREVRRRGFLASELPAVALTAFVHSNDERDALSAGFQIHVAKPVDVHELTSVIARLAGRSESTS
jgi:signal transduction histidine kinase/CheY-like chemotaxis protein